MFQIIIFFITKRQHLSMSLTQLFMYSFQAMFDLTDMSATYDPIIYSLSLFNDHLSKIIPSQTFLPTQYIIVPLAQAVLFRCTNQFTLLTAQLSIFFGVSRLIKLVCFNIRFMAFQNAFSRQDNFFNSNLTNLIRGFSSVSRQVGQIQDD